MSMHGLLQALKQHLDCQHLLENRELIENRIEIINDAKSALIAYLHSEIRKPILYVVKDLERASRLVDELQVWCIDDTPVLLYPEYSVLPYERMAVDIMVVQQRLRAINTLHNWNSKISVSPPLLVTSCVALSQKTLSYASFEAACITVKKGDRIDPQKLLSWLVSIGYEVDEITEFPGQISKRGGVLDVFSLAYDQPFRIEFFGSQVESIRQFDRENQRSLEKTEEIRIIPATEVLLGGKPGIQEVFRELDYSGCNDETINAIKKDMEFLLNGERKLNLNFYSPMFNRDCLIHHLPGESALFIDTPQEISAEIEALYDQASEMRDRLHEKGELPKNFPIPCLRWTDIEATSTRIDNKVFLGSLINDAIDINPGFHTAPLYGGKVSDFLEDLRMWLKKRYRVVIASRQAERIAALLQEEDLISLPVKHLAYLPEEGSVTVVDSALSNGWMLDNTVVITDYELFGIRKKRRSLMGKRSQREIFVSDLSIGDYVVHIDHGIARFAGMKTMMYEGKEREYLILEYSDDGKLYVPIDQVDRVTRYVGSGGYTPKLSRLHTQEWARSRERVKQATAEIASDLISIYALRQVSEGIAFPADSPWEHELEASFPYQETPDQTETIRDVKNDMQKPVPMDRLICGDVGYGKTEIAVRAAFKAVNHGMQVAILVPTTVLAQQHFMTFRERLAAYPVNIEMLSRFRSPQEQRQVIEGLAYGTVDICIGTHRLIQKDVKFYKLGLIIVDEEQKFGVVHKERLKKFRSEVDVLTLSATPIPRSLHMSLLGIRDMSTIETAPAQRIPIKTYVNEYDEDMIRRAIMRELDRGGQVFFVHNRVQTIGAVAERVRNIVPQADVSVAHGQMREKDLEKEMVDFSQGSTDVLVCTTIIESGLDIPRVNTLIINQADRLGLTQLYHLRGRVGRGDVRAYAYLFYDKRRQLTSQAQERLQTIFEATELGAGFRIAMKDLEIRGAGNILGAEQSGHVGAVGFDLYCRLLSESVEELKTGMKVQPQEGDPSIDLPLDAHIPEHFVPDLKTRLALYHRIAILKTPAETREFWGDIRDRFGDVPPELDNLLSMTRIKLLARQAGVSRIFFEGNQLVVIPTDTSRSIMDHIKQSFGSSVRVGNTRMSLDRRQLGEHWLRILEELLRSMASHALPAQRLAK